MLGFERMSFFSHLLRLLMQRSSVELLVERKSCETGCKEHKAIVTQRIVLGTPKPEYEVADIFRRYGEAYRRNHKLTSWHYQ